MEVVFQPLSSFLSFALSIHTPFYHFRTLFVRPYQQIIVNMALMSLSIFNKARLFDNVLCTLSQWHARYISFSTVPEYSSVRSSHEVTLRLLYNLDSEHPE